MQPGVTVAETFTLFLSRQLVGHFIFNADSSPLNLIPSILGCHIERSLYTSFDFEGKFAQIK